MAQKNLAKVYDVLCDTLDKQSEVIQQKNRLIKELTSKVIEQDSIIDELMGHKAAN